MPTHGVEPMMIGEPIVAIERLQQITRSPDHQMTRVHLCRDIEDSNA